mgnify:CR=1 FL=1
MTLVILTTTSSIMKTLIFMTSLTVVVALVIHPSEATMTKEGEDATNANPYAKRVPIK